MECVDITGSYAELWFQEVCGEKAAAERVLRRFYPYGPKCARCGASITGKRPLQTFWAGSRTYCASCDSKFSPRAGNQLLAESHLTYAQLEELFVLISLGVDYSRIASIAGIHPDTVATWHSKIRFWESHV